MSPSASFERLDAHAQFRKWFSSCGQTLAIVGSRHAGKTYFARQLSQMKECVASHFCRSDEPQSSESATMIRSIGDQLTKRFPNLVLPRLSTVTLLNETTSAIDHVLRMPLETMPSPSKPVFMIIDNVNSEMTFVNMVKEILPEWIRMVITIDKNEQKKMDDYHILDMDKETGDLERFIRYRIPHCQTSQLLQASNGSWFFVDQISRAIDVGLSSTEMIVPASLDELMTKIAKQLPISFPDIIRLAKTCRLRPTRQQLLAVSQMLISREISVIDKDIRTIECMICHPNTDDIFDVPTIWMEYVGDDYYRCHAAWAEHFKTKRRKTAQDVVELAYHLAHSSANPNNAIRTLQSVGAGNIVLKCPVIDTPTTMLLTTAGATIINNNHDVVYACSIGDVGYLEAIMKETKPSNLDICFGLLTASARGNIDMCRFIADNFPNVVASCCGEWNALRSAACYGQLDILHLLLDKGVDVDECGHSDRTALRAAAWSGQLAAVQLLLQTDAAVDRRDSEQRTALMAAAFMGHRDVVSVMLDYGANINAVDNNGATALHLILSNGSNSDDHLSTTQLLIDSGADCTIEDSNGRVALHIAAYHGDASIPLILDKIGTFVDVQDTIGQTPLMLAASQGQLKSTKYLMELGKADIDAIDNTGRTALQLAAVNGHADVVEYLCSIGADEGHKDNDGNVALHGAVIHDDTRLIRPLLNKHTVEAVDRYGRHPVMIACEHGSLKVLDELLNVSDTINKPDHEGKTAVHCAALSGHIPILDRIAPLVKDWNQRDSDGTPLLHLLLNSHQTYIAEVMFGYGAKPSVSDVHGRSCVHIVASTNDINAAKMLKSVGANFEDIDLEGRSALMTAVWSKHLQMAYYLLDCCGVEPNRCDKQGATALSIAAQIGDRELITLLLRFGAEPEIRDKFGRTSIDIANISGHEAITPLLQSANGSSGSSGIGSSVPNSPMDPNRARRATNSLKIRIEKRKV